MQVRSKLIDTALPENPSGVVILLHGGASRRGDMMVSPTQLSVLRMVPIAERVKHVGRDRLAVFRLLNSVRGWDSSHTPVSDVRWALGEIADRLGSELPTCLIGHSLGGRAALLAGDAAPVTSVVALAPWVYPTDAHGGLAGRKVLVVHGTNDRIARPDRSEAVTKGLSDLAEVSYVRVTGGKHAMLKRHRVFDGLAADFAAATLLGGTKDPTVARALAGERWLDV